MNDYSSVESNAQGLLKSDYTPLQAALKKKREKLKDTKLGSEEKEDEESQS